MSGSASNAGSNAGDAVKKGVGLVHGLGEAIRGNVNAAADSATGNRGSAAKQEAIASHGAEEIDRGYHHHHGTGVGVTPVDTDRERVNRAAPGGYTTGTTGTTGTIGNTGTTGTTDFDIPDAQTDGSGDHSTNYGPHSTDIGNKLDPRYDSDLDHRGPRDHSTNYGPHSSNIGNKLDPRYDSDRDHRAAEGSKNYGPHRTNIANKLDPRYDSDLDHRGSKEGSTNYGPHRTNVGNKLDPRYDSDLDHRGPGYHDHGVATGSTNYGPHSTNIGNKLDPRYDSDLDHRGIGGSANYGSHSANAGYKLDPRYDSDFDHRGRRSSWGPEGQQEYGYSDNDQRVDGNIGTDNFERASRELMGASNRNHAEGVRDSGEDRYQEEYGDQYGDHYSASSGPPHSSNTLNKLDPRWDSKHDYYQGSYRAPYYDDPPYSYYDDSRYLTSVRRRDSEPMPRFTNAYEDIESRPPRNTPLPPRDAQQHRPPQAYEVHDRLQQEAKKHAPHSYRVANILDPRTPARSPAGNPHSTEYPHKSGFLNLVDPRVSAKTVRKERSRQEKSGG